MRKSFVVLVSLVALCSSGCSKPESEPAKPTAAAAPQADTLAKVPVLPGYKYYVGGPNMKRDKYGRFRISNFNDEVQQPPSRGMVFGAKLEGDKLEYRVWGNGKLLGMHRGTMRDGLFWREYAESYRNGKIVSRTHEVPDDETKRVKVTLEDIDPENGEVIRTTESFVSYLPPAMPKDMKDDVELDSKQGDMPAVNPAAPAPPAAPGTGEKKDEAR